uniref:Uncharacterized protein n=2 Tax=Kalmanozyma brasiliensis (strain GHG001) TaxID=1365824 RepID=V5E9M7_KALBG
MLRKKSYKNKKDKETVRMLQDWLSLQFNAPALDFTISQDSIQPSQDISLPPAAGQPVKDAAAAVNESADPIVFTQESAVESAPASSPTTGKKASSAKASVAKKSILARATPEPELPPPSGVAAPAEPPSASTAKPTAKAPRAQSKKAAATAQAKAAKKAVASTMSEPNIALTPSSPLQPSQTQFSQPPGTGLRAPSESSEAELATSPLLSAVPRASDDMDVDELPSNTPSRPSTAAQQLEERKRRMKLADAASTSSPRSRSASITSSDTSHGGQSSDDESDADSDAGGTAAKVGRKGTGKQAKPASSKPPRSPVAKKARTAAAARKDASSGTDTSSSDSETESEPDTSKKSTSRAKPSGDNANVKTPASKTTKRLPPPDNPFLRGLTPVSSRQNGAGSNKSTPFTRLSELKPASLRQNLSQPGSPLSTGGSTPLSASGQTPFFASQPVMNGDGNGSTDSSAAAGAFTTAAATPEPAQAETASEDDDESDSSSSSSSEDEAPKRGKASAKASTGAKRAGKGVGAKTATPAAAKKRKSVFDVFGKSG